MVRFKIFFGASGVSADVFANEWLKDNPNIEVLDFKYEHRTSTHYHSICIMYKEN